MDNLNKWLDQVEREIARQEALSEEESRYVLLKSPVTYQISTVSIFFYFTNCRLGVLKQMLFRCLDSADIKI